MDELIETYIYGSAVVAYFLTHLYGPASEKDFERVLKSARPPRGLYKSSRNG